MDKATAAPSRAHRRRLLALCIVALLGLLAVVMAEAQVSASSQLLRSRLAASRLDLQLQEARAEGYTAEDLAPITAARSRIDAQPEPLWIGDRPGFFQRRGSDYGELATQLSQLEASLLAQSRKSVSDRLQAAADGIQQARTLGADEVDVSPLQASLDGLTQKAQAGQSISDVRGLVQPAEQLAGKASDLQVALAAETSAIQRSAAGLETKLQGNADAIRKVGSDALAQGRNDATAATWLKTGGFERPYRLLEKYGAGLGSQQGSDLAFAAAAVQRYAQQIRDVLLQGMPSKAIVISMQGQELWGYQGSQLVRDTLVTTGRPPNLATDIGPMKVLWKQSPWKMHSPWPQGSPYWYPDTTVQMVVWFTNTGEGLHDAYWQSTPYGPGSQYGPSASHGCVHVPYEAETFLYNWAEAGTPLVIIPGDGTSVDNQVKQKTVDDDGVPFTGPKGA